MRYVIIAHQSDPQDQSEELDSMNGLRNPDVLYFGSEGKEMESLDDVQEVLNEYCIEEDGRSYEVLEYKQIHESRSKPFGNPKLWKETGKKDSNNKRLFLHNKAKELLSLCDSEQDDHSADFVLWACEASANTQVLVQELLEKHWRDEHKKEVLKDLALYLDDLAEDYASEDTVWFEKILRGYIEVLNEITQEGE